MEGGVFEVLFIISPTFTLTHGGSRQQHVEFKNSISCSKNRKKKKDVGGLTSFSGLSVRFHEGAYSDMETLRDCTSGKELLGSFSILRECSHHYCEAVVSLFFRCFSYSFKRLQTRAPDYP